MPLSNIVVIVSYYNFSRSRVRKQALQHCLNSLPGDAEVILVAMGERPEIFRKIKLVEVSEGGVLWQRERFWNIALENTGSHNEVVVWIDADVVFADDAWVERLEKQLTQSAIVHLFSSVTDVQYFGGRLASTDRVRQSIVKIGQLPGEVAFDQYFSKSGISLSLGCSPGFAWATNVELIKALGFPDFLILGSGDKAFLAAALGYQREYAEALQLNPCLKNRYLAWAKTVYERIEGRIGYIENNILHIAQGVYEHRRYGDRYSIIGSSDFSLPRFLKINTQGAWVWSDEGKQYADRIKVYFEGRDD